MPRNLEDMLSPCVLCPRQCGVDRRGGETGFCGIAADAVIASAGPHWGEEPPLVGRGGSGTVFFSGCNLGCVFCQNAEISHLRQGRTVDADELSRTMLGLQAAGCHNINWVTPTHQMPAIMRALQLARQAGLTVPTVYNCGGYERVDVLRLLKGHVSIYMPDAKYISSDSASRYSKAPDYPDVMKAALQEMHRQVGDLQIRDGLAVKGLLVRHLVMPGLVEESLAIMDFLANEVSPNTYVNVMAQYGPCFEAHRFPRLSRRITSEEYRTVLVHAKKLGLRLASC